MMRGKRHNLAPSLSPVLLSCIVSNDIEKREEMQHLNFGLVCYNTSICTLYQSVC